MPLAAERTGQQSGLAAAVREDQEPVLAGAHASDADQDVSGPEQDNHVDIGGQAAVGTDEELDLDMLGLEAVTDLPDLQGAPFGLTAHW